MRENTKIALSILIAVIFFLGSLAYAKFQWTECRRDPDHTFWHCVAVID